MLFKRFPLDNIPTDWLSTDTSNFAITEFEYFLKKGNLDLPEIQRLRLLVKKGVKDFLWDVVDKGHYKNITELTAEELETLPDLSTAKYNRFTEFFKRDKINKLQLKGKEISLFKLKEFTHVNFLRHIPLLITTDMHEFSTKVFTCFHCKGKRTIEQQVRIRDTSRYSAFNDNNKGVFRGDGYTYRSQTISCPSCNGSGVMLYYFHEFKKVVEKYNVIVEKTNNEISDLNNMCVRLIEEYNSIIEELNGKIRIWNKKCPYNAIDKNHQSSEDCIKYWLERTMGEVATEEDCRKDSENYHKILSMLQYEEKRRQEEEEREPTDEEKRRQEEEERKEDMLRKEDRRISEERRKRYGKKGWFKR